MRNGSGTYQAPSGSWNPATNGNSATAADWNTLLADIASALTQSVSADGQTPITGNLNMGNNKLTGLAAGNASDQSVAWQQLFSQGTESDIASASTVDIGAQNTNFLRVTGTTTITSFGTNYNGPRFLRFAGALTLTHNGSTLILPTGANITTAAGDCCIALPISGGWYVAAYQRASGVQLGTVPIANGGTGQTTAAAALTALGGFPFARNYHQGFTMSTAGSSTTMTIGSGQCADSTNAVLIDLAASINKTTSAWAVGTNNGGLDTGSIANSTWYSFYAIRRPDTGVVDVVFSTNHTSPTLPTNYTQFRWLGIWRTNGSGQWEQMVQSGDTVFSYATTDASLSVTTTRAAYTISTAPPIRTLATLNVGSGSGSGYVFVSSDGAPDVTPVGLGNAAANHNDKIITVRSTSSGQLQIRGAAAGSISVMLVSFNIAEYKGR